MKEPLLPVNGSHSNNQDIIIGYPDSKERIVISVSLFPENLEDGNLEEFKLILGNDLINRKYLTHAQLQKRIGIDSENLKPLSKYFKEFNITTESVSPLGLNFQLEGHVQSFNEALSIKIGVYKDSQNGKKLGYNGFMFLPADIGKNISRIELSPANRNFERREHVLFNVKPKDLENSEGISIKDLTKVYNFPADATGNRQCIAIIELGGNYVEKDVALFCDENEIKRPSIICRGRVFNEDYELTCTGATIDVQIITAIAPKAKIVIYNAHSILEGMKAIICDRKYKPDIVSISWTAPESNYSINEVEELNNVFKQAALLGITVISSSGDKGAYNGQNFPTVSMPSACPYVLSCGGTSLNLEKDRFPWEVVWNEPDRQVASGGGFSSIFRLPAFQAKSLNPNKDACMRGIPDVSAHAESVKGFELYVDGEKRLVGGTQIATAVWAGLIALLNEKINKNIGFANSLFYNISDTGSFNSVNYGHNEHYAARPGWDPCTGLGSPNGLKLLNELAIKLSQPKENVIPDS